MKLLDEIKNCKTLIYKDIMHSVLVVAATEMELATLPSLFKDRISFFVSGAGTPCTIMRLTELFVRKQFTLAINIGIAGSYATDVVLGSVFRIAEDSFADLGIDTDCGFVPLREFPFCPSEILSLADYAPVSIDLDLPLATGYTFNTVHGNYITIKRLGITSGLETMEGAAVQMVCQRFRVPHIQIRAVSNYVESRDPSRWDIPLALKHLEAEISAILEQLLNERI